MKLTAGVGQIARIYSLFVPVHPSNTPHLIEKVNDVLTQEGEGEDKNDESSIITNSEESNDVSMTENNEKKRSNMDEGVIDSFLHPKKIKIGEILLPKKELNKSSLKKVPNSTNSNKTPKISHKFKIV